MIDQQCNNQSDKTIICCRTMEKLEEKKNWSNPVVEAITHVW